MKKTEPTKLMYIGVWILYAVVGKLILNGAEVFMEKMELTNMNSIIIFATVIEAALIIGIFIIIYNSFSMLNMRKVFPWFVGLTLLGTLGAVVETLKVFAEYNIDSTLYLALVPLEVVVVIYVIRSYYINKPKRWY